MAKVLVHRICEDPIERIIQVALEAAMIEYVLEGEVPSAGQTLDFWLPAFGLYIECKQYHTPRIADQMSRAPNIIVLQGRASAEFFANALTTGAGSTASEVCAAPQGDL